MWTHDQKEKNTEGRESESGEWADAPIKKLEKEGDKEDRMRRLETRSLKHRVVTHHGNRRGMPRR